MCAVVPRDGFSVNQPDIGLVDQRRSLEAVAGTLSRHAAPGNAVELLMD